MGRRVVGLIVVLAALAFVLLGVALAGSLAAPTITSISPASVSNAANAPVLITGTGFTAVPIVYLGTTLLEDVGRVSTTTLTTTVPWGLDPGIYSLTVVITPGQPGILTDAFTVTQGFGVWTTGGPFGGQVEDLVVHPVTPTTVFAIIFQVGIFASYDSGDSWQMILVDDFPTRMSIDAENPRVMYAAGDGGVLRTMDGGESWQPITPPDGTPEWEQFTPLAHPTVGGVIYCGERTPDDPGEPGGLWKSINHGTSWTSETVGLTDTNVIDFAYHPSDPDVMLLATLDGDLFATTNAGGSWAWQARPSDHAQRTYYNPTGAHEGWLLAQAPRNGGSAGPATLFKSDNLAAWQPVTVAENTQPLALAFVGEEVWAAAGEIYTTADLGDTWQWLDAPGLPRQDHRYIGSLAATPGDPDSTYAGDTGDGVYLTADGGATWSEKNQGLAGVEPQALAVTPSLPDTLYVNTSGRGLFKSNNGGQSWRSLDYYTGGPPRKHLLAVEPEDPSRIYMASQANDACALQISEDGGDSWREVQFALPITWTGQACMVTSIATHPAVKGRLLSGVSIDKGGGNFLAWPSFVYRSDNYGEDWAFAGPGEPISRVNEFSFDAGDSGIAYAASQGTGLWKTVDGGQTWARLVNFPGVTNLTSVAAHPDVPDMVYALSENQKGSGIHVTIDAGASWNYITDQSGVQIMIAPPAPGADSYALYTSCGAFTRAVCRSEDGGATWAPVPGSPRPTTLASGTDGERVLIYMGSPGGTVPQAAASSAMVRAPDGAIPGRGSLLGAGVYQWVDEPGQQPPGNPRVYLPLVLRYD